MASALSRITTVAVLVVGVLAAGCAAPAPTPRTIGLHLENHLTNVVVFSRGNSWVGTPPPASFNSQVIPACGGHLDVSVPAATSEKPSLVSLEIDTSGIFDQQLALASNNLDELPVNVLLKALIFWSRGNIDSESWVTITPDEVLLSRVAPAAPTTGRCAPWAYTPEPS